ncbi:hypothetical protein [Alicyclobacillus dauci]|uniref:Uncharacterized protein n=1 Tax=Alicyclobacillus dauci TaxID=1475485 RepID=A0ABY6Z2S1_9BACL|nr:hypothetical protein [Alicyclobacillus dauci]WAH36621.1 hypothetical protein NZD86_20970 [Alicyclobacillus dauci]
MHINRRMLMAVMISGAFVAILNETLLNIALPPIMREMSISANTAQWFRTAHTE